MGKSGTGHQCLFTTNGVGSTLSVVKCTLQVSKSVSDYCCRLLLLFFYLLWASCFASTKMTEWVNVAPNEQFSDVLGWEQVIGVFLWDDEVRFVLDQHAELYFYSASSRRQQLASRHVATRGHIILIPNQSVFALTPYCCGFTGEATNTNFIVLGLTRSGLEHTIYRTRAGYAIPLIYPQKTWAKVNNSSLISSYLP